MGAHPAARGLSVGSLGGGNIQGRCHGGHLAVHMVEQVGSRSKTGQTGSWG